MAVFTPDTVGNISNLNDLRKVQEYLYRLNEQLQYAMTHLELDSAEITGGMMTGTTAADMKMQSGSIGPFKVDSAAVGNTELSLSENGQAKFADVSITDPFWNGQTVTQVVKTIWDEVFPS